MQRDLFNRIQFGEITQVQFQSHACFHGSAQFPSSVILLFSFSFWVLLGGLQPARGLDCAEGCTAGSVDGSAESVPF